ncbi:hypothetical protein K457DRAFT_634727 [Linnemannia elongata AG-77]|uniref:Uncharacterized protein n=1 Tax=Linnemannia elongata AG-77 TaxID=1314771 RepID=A0A197JSX5_9FUNG|nr:hypothetical protein K457DRAFT_634727 [Linnemannia elongata AG-77]
MSTPPPSRPFNSASSDARKWSRRSKRPLPQVQQFTKAGRMKSASSAYDGLTQAKDSQKIESTLRTLRRQRLSEYMQPVYIEPMAKPTLQASGDMLFPLMDKVKDFLSGDSQVMLILGDSGAGKSTFNR